MTAPPPLEGAAVIHDDEDLVVVDKPWGMPTHAASAERGDDVLTRLQTILAIEGAPPPYLGTHHRLDRDTSGVLLFSRRKSANPSLAAQFEKRAVEKTYLAVVEGDVRGLEGRVLRHKIVEGESGAVRALPEGHPHGKIAVTRFDVVRRAGKRALISAKPETGRTHQIRVQLQQAGAPIVGDTLYGGAPFARLLLHAERLALRHPATGSRVTFRAEPPEELLACLAGEGDRFPAAAEVIQARVRAAASRRFGIQSASNTALRLVHGAGDLLPGLTVDALGDFAVVSLLADFDAATENVIFDAVMSLGARGVYVKRRPKHASRIVDARRDDLAPRAPVRGETAPEEFEILENGVPYLVRAGDGLSTGLFLDQRENRKRIADLAPKKRVLNLFSYTAGFSVAAGVHGAATSVSVDAARPATEWARRNFVRAGLSEAHHVLIDMDCFAYLAGARKRDERFDLAVVDPPSFSTTKAKTFRAAHDYGALAEEVFAVMRPGGTVFFCTNHAKVSVQAFRKTIGAAAHKAGRDLEQLKSVDPPRDFPPAPGEPPHMKTVIARLATGAIKSASRRSEVRNEQSRNEPLKTEQSRPTRAKPGPRTPRAKRPETTRARRGRR